MEGKQNKGNALKSLNYRKQSSRCSVIKKDGERCRAIAMKSTGKCSIHSGILPYQSAKIQLDRSILDVRKYLVKLMIDTRKGKVSPMTANSLANLSDKVLKCYQLTDIEEKLEEIAKKMDRRANIIQAQDADSLDPESIPKELPEG